jgi:hypothetical protein
MTVQAQPDPLRFLRILVDGEPSFSLSIIEALRRNGTKYDLTLEFAGGYGAPYDLRLIASGGSGSASGIVCLAKTRLTCIFNNFARHSPTHYFPDQNSHLAYRDR